MNRDIEDIPSVDDPPRDGVLRQGHEPLRVPLNSEEHRAKGRHLAALLQEKARLVQHHKDVRAEQKAELAEIEGRIDETQADVSLQSEVRSVEVEDIADFRRGVVDTIRVDTGVVVRTRKLEEHERQGRLA